MNSIHLVTQEKYRVEKRIENRPSAPSAQPKARPRAQRPGRGPSALPHAQRPAACPTPCRAPSALPCAPRRPLPPACACAQVPLARVRTPTQRPPAARATLALCAPARSPCAPQHARLRPSAPARACCLAQRRVVTQLPVLRHKQPCLLPLFLTIQFFLYCDQLVLSHVSQPAIH